MYNVHQHTPTIFINFSNISTYIYCSGVTLLACNMHFFPMFLEALSRGPSLQLDCPYTAAQWSQCQRAEVQGGGLWETARTRQICQDSNWTSALLYSVYFCLVCIRLPHFATTFCTHRKFSWKEQLNYDTFRRTAWFRGQWWQSDVKRLSSGFKVKPNQTPAALLITVI